MDITNVNIDIDKSRMTCQTTKKSICSPEKESVVQKI